METERSEYRCDSAWIMHVLLKTCFGTTMVEPGRWTLLSTAAPHRRYFWSIIRNGGRDKPAFTNESVGHLNSLFKAALRIESDTSSYEPEVVAICMTNFLREMGWGDFSEYSRLNDEIRGPENKGRLAFLLLKAMTQLIGKIDVNGSDGGQIRESLLKEKQLFEEKDAERELLARFESDARARRELAPSVDLLMSQIDFPDEAGYLSPRQEQDVWKALSKMYCGGTRVDAIIRAGLQHGLFDRYGPQAPVVMTYCASKFSLKRGRVDQSDADLHALEASLRAKRSEVDDVCAKRLSALAGIRKLTNRAEPTAEHVEAFRNAVDALQELGYASDEYKAYETASAIGAEITNALVKGPAQDSATLRLFESLADEHKSTIDRYRETLSNQKVVAVSLEWFMELSDLAGKPKDDRNPQALLHIAFKGLRTAKEQRNSLFHIQCVMILAICALCSGNEDLLMALGVIVGRLMGAFEINRLQEGVRQLLSIMDTLRKGASNTLLADPDQQLEKMKQRGSILLGWTKSLEAEYRKEIVPRMRAYNVPIDERLMKLECFTLQC